MKFDTFGLIEGTLVKLRYSPYTVVNRYTKARQNCPVIQHFIHHPNMPSQS